MEIEYTVHLTAEAAWGGETNRCAVTLTSAEGTVYAGEAAQIASWGFYCYRGVAIPDSAKKSNPLSGGCFSLYYDSGLTDRVAFVRTGEAAYMACTAVGCTHSRHVYLLKTPATGVVTLAGLRAGTYYLHETMPPKGYSVAAECLAVTVDVRGGVTADGMAVPDGMVKVIERTAGETEAAAQRDPLTFYENGCKVLSAVMAVLVIERKRLFC